MYIEPGTNIKLLHNVPLDTTYDHTIYFDSATNQQAYFSSLTKYNLTNYTYQRVRRGFARVGIVADSLYDCNYMMFQNINFGSKWFYAFIKSVEYINNECSEIQFEIDVIQTWLFDFTLDQCFIERNHTVTDVIGQNIVPEPVECGEYVFNDNYEPLFPLNDMAVIIGVLDVDQSTVEGELYDGVYGACQLTAFDSTDVNGINGFLDNFVQAYDNVVTIYMLPKAFLFHDDLSGGYKLPYGASGSPQTWVGTPIASGTTLDHHTPKNNKLYTYPYNFYHVDNHSGEALSLRYEFFDGYTPRLQCFGTITQPVKVNCYPVSYKGVPQYSELGGYTANGTESLQLNNYPLCSWNMDSFQAWLAQNSLPIATTVISSALSGGISSFVSGMSSFKGNLTEPIVKQNAISDITSLLTQTYRASIASDIIKGNFNNGSVNCANHMQNFYGGRMSVSQQYAQMIDDFFTRYGYAIHKLDTPNVSSRPHWNYIKTVGCTATGSVPADDMRKICQIHDNGITYWKNGDEIGNYSLDNSPT